MAFSFRRFLKGITIIPKTTSTVSAAGDIDFDTTANKLNLHNGTTASPVVTEAHSATLTNKTIDADSNTISNIENADIKAAAAIDATKIADGSVTNTEFQYVGGVTSDIQTQLNGKQATGNYITALTGDVTAAGPGSVAATVASVGGSSAANVAAAEALANAATNLNTASTIVKRDASGNFSAGTITAGLTGNVTGNVSGTALNVTGTVAIANGGTGQTSQTAAFDALAPTTTKGDIVVHNGTDNIRIPVGTDGQLLSADSSQASGVKWIAGSSVPPTVQTFTTGSGTYTTPAGVKYLKIKLVGGGGGGAGGGTSGQTSGSNGTDTTFGSSFLIAGGGTGGGALGNIGGIGGVPTITFPAVGISFYGQTGGGGAFEAVSSIALPGGYGGNSAFAGGGGSGYSAAGTAGASNTGGGGAGGGCDYAVSVYSGTGGGAGAYVEVVVPSPSATYSYAVGDGGSAGTAGASGYAGGNGAKGIIYVEEYY